MQQQNFSNSSAFSGPSVEALATSAVMGLCFVLGIPGNLVVMVLLVKHLKDGSFTPKLLLSLAVSDLLSLIFLPLWIYTRLKEWVFGRALCKLISYLVCWGVCSSVFSVSLLSVQRFLQVLYPQRWAKLGAQSQTGLIFGLWTASGALASYSLYYRDLKRKKDGRMVCDHDYGNNQEKIAVLLVETVVMFLVPLFSLVCFYLRLHQRVSRSVSFSSHRMTTLTLRIVVTFFIFGIPCAINNFVAMAMPLDSEISHSVTRALFIINSCVNPFLYAFSARTLRSRGAQHTLQSQPPQSPTGQTVDL